MSTKVSKNDTKLHIACHHGCIYIPKEGFNYLDFWYIDVCRCSCELFMVVFYYFPFLIFILHCAMGIKRETLHENYPNTELFLVRTVFSPNEGKYGREITPYLDIFHAVRVTH